MSFLIKRRSSLLGILPLIPTSPSQHILEHKTIMPHNLVPFLILQQCSRVSSLAPLLRQQIGQEHLVALVERLLQLKGWTPLPVQ